MPPSTLPTPSNGTPYPAASSSTPAPAPTPAPANHSAATTPVPPAPRTAHLLSLLLASLGVDDAPPATVHHLLDFANRYTFEILSDAQVYAEHAGRTGAGGVELGDVELAVSSRANHSFTVAPPKEYLLELSQTLNSRPLPPIPESYGPRLPPSKHRLTAPNFSLIPAKAPTAPAPSSPTKEGGDAEEGAGEDGDEDDDGDTMSLFEGMDTGDAPGEASGAGAREGGGGGGEEEKRGEKRKLEEDEEYD